MSLRLILVIEMAAFSPVVWVQCRATAIAFHVKQYIEALLNPSHMARIYG